MAAPFRRVLVTGGSGFFGSAVVRQLRAHGYDKIVAPRKAECDLREQSQVRRLVGEVKPELVIHMAAMVGGIGANKANPGTFFYDNLLMGVMLMEECRSAQVQKFVGVGTICSYPKFTPVPFKEDDLWNGYPEETNAPYGLAKKMLLVQGQAYRQQFGFNAIHLLPVNLYGPGDNFDPGSSHVIPALIRKCQEAIDQSLDEIVVWGDGSPTREFLYVDDAARAVALAVQHYNDPDPVNLGSSFEISIRDLAFLIADMTGFKGEVRFDATKPNGQPRRKLNVDRAKAAFGFEATTTFENGLAKTVEWYKRHREQWQLAQGRA